MTNTIYIIDLKENEYLFNMTSNSREDIKLLQDVEETKEYDKLSIKYNMTLSNILLRVLYDIICVKYKNNVTSNIVNISKEYNISVDLIIKYINKFKKIINPSENTIIDTMNDSEIFHSFILSDDGILYKK